MKVLHRLFTLEFSFCVFVFFLVDMSELLEILEACFIGKNYEPFM